MFFGVASYHEKHPATGKVFQTPEKRFAKAETPGIRAPEWGATRTSADTVSSVASFNSRARAGRPGYMADPDGAPTDLSERDWLAREARYAVSPTPAELAEAQRQYDAIEARYTNPDGTKKPGWMKAPNGKPTNLTERQWVQVRTENFKKWFGDWEAAANATLRNSANSYAQAREIVETLVGRQLESADGIKATLSRSAIDKIFSGKATGKSVSVKAHLAAAANIGQLYAAAVELAADKGNRAGIKTMHRLFAPFYFEGRTLVAKLSVKEFERKTDGGNRLYTIEAMEIESAAGDLGSKQSGEAGKDTPAQPTAQILRELAEKVNPSSVSKVVDENGEPRVVFHGTTNEETRETWNPRTRTFDIEHSPFTVFRRRVDGVRNSGAFFNSSEDNAGGYGSRVYKVFLNLRNPLVIDANNSDYSHITHNGATRDTYEWAEWAERNGYDGLIIKNVRDGVDYGAMSSATADYVAFRPNQIKSADPVTYDDAGNVIPLSRRFNPQRDDIRYSFASTIGGRNVFGMEGQSEAARMAAAGASREDIWRKTGWWKGKDGKWRVEIPDLSLKAHVVETVRDVLDRQAEFSFDRLPTGEDAEGNFGFNVLVADAFVLRAERRLWEAAVRDNAEGWRRDLQTVADAPLESEEFRAGVARMMPLAREVVDGEALEYALRENGNYNFKKIANDLLRFMVLQARSPSGEWVERDMEQERNRIDEGFRFAAEMVVDLGQLAWTDNAPLFRAYSFLRGVPVEFRKLSGAYAEADPTPGRYRITVDADRFRKNPSTLLSSLAHEVQHLIQAEEGLAKGGDVRTAHNAFLNRKNRELETISAAKDRAKEELLRMSIPADASAEDRAAFDQARMEKGREVMRLVAKYDETMREKLQRDPFESYRRLAGETEARAVQARLAMTPEQRGSTPPWESYDVDEADQVIRYSFTPADVFAPTGDAREREVPVSALVTYKREPEQSVRNAARFMEEARDGRREKRAPLLVAYRDDGTFVVVDGTATATVLAATGSETALAVVKGPDLGSRLSNSHYALREEGVLDARKNKIALRTEGLDGLDPNSEEAREKAYRDAEDNLPALESLTRKAAEEVGGKAKFHPENKKNDPDADPREVGKRIKKRKRVETKKADYEGDYRGVVDLIGTTITLSPNLDLTDAVKAIRRNLPEGASVARVKFLSNPDAGGYWDVKVSVRFANGGIGEIILADENLTDAKFNRGGHELYDFQRALEPLRESDEEADRLWKSLKKLELAIYAHNTPQADARCATWDSAKASAMSSLTRLHGNGNASISSAFIGKLKDLLSGSHLQSPASLDSYATPAFSLIQNDISGDLQNVGAPIAPTAETLAQTASDVNPPRASGDSPK